jgi:uncharacterized protein (UPF0335 family)
MGQQLTDTEMEMIDSFIDQKRSEEQNLTLQFANEILNHMLQKKEIDGYIKDIKTDAKANGILVKQVMKAINDLKKELKTTDVEKSEEDLIITLLDNDFGIKNKIQKLIEKD